MSTKEKIHIVLPLEQALFLRITSARTKKEQSTIVSIALDLLKHVLDAGAAADELLAFIEQKNPALVEQVIELRNRIEETKVAEVVA